MNQQRNLRIGPHPLITGRRYPVVLHHWREDELRTFLEDDRYPARTFDERELARRQAVVDAVAVGEYAPDAVLSEDPSLEATGIAERERRVRFDEESERRLAREKVARDHFERDVGYTISFDEYYARLAIVLRDYFVRPVEHMRTACRWGNWDLGLRVIPGRQPEYGRYGQINPGRPPALRIAVLGEGVMIAHDVEWDVANDLMLALLRAREISIEHVWYIFGTGWVPNARARFATVTSLATVGADSRQVAQESATMTG